MERTHRHVPSFEWEWIYLNSWSVSWGWIDLRIVEFVNTQDQHYTIIYKQTDFLAFMYYTSVYTNGDSFSFGYRRMNLRSKSSGCTRRYGKLSRRMPVATRRNRPLPEAECRGQGSLCVNVITLELCWTRETSHELVPSRRSAISPRANGPRMRREKEHVRKKEYVQMWQSCQ